MKYILILLFFIFSSCKCSAQKTFKDEVNTFNLELIQRGQKGRFYSKSYLGEEEIKSKYLGYLIDMNKDKFFIVVTIHVTNKSQSPTFSNTIIVYNGDKEFIRYYSVSLKNQLPTKIVDNEMYFENLATIAEPKKVSFYSGVLPNMNLGGENPDIYEFIKHNQ